MKTIFFEWQDYEEEIYSTLNFQNPNRIFISDTFNTNKIPNGVDSISIFIDSKITNQQIDELAALNIKKIAIRAAGYNMLNVEYAKSKGIQIYRVASYSPESIAEHVFALLLFVVRKLSVERNKHLDLVNTRNKESMGITLKGKTLGLYGIGKIGEETAKIAKGFGMNVIFFDKFVNGHKFAIKKKSLEELFQESDIVSIHVPLTEETKYSVNKSIISRMKRGSYIINTARGDIVNSEDIIEALNQSIIAGLGVDVWDSGTNDDKFDTRLHRHNVIQTKHIAFLTKEAVKEIITQTLENLSGNARKENTL